MPLAGRFGSLLCVLLLGMALVFVTTATAEATFYPAPIRLSLLFGRAPWQPGPSAVLSVPPGHIAERWER